MNIDKEYDKLNKKLNAKGYLYFVRFGNIVKIGSTLNIDNRMSQLIVGNPFVQLSRLLYLKGYELAERKFQDYFKRYNVLGEWYNISDSQIEQAKSDIIKGEIELIDDKEYSVEEKSHSPYEEITILQGENKSLKSENKLLRQIINELHKTIKIKSK